MQPAFFLSKAVRAALEAGHMYPEYAACEAALESGWGESKLCRLANNLFGQKHGPSTMSAEIIDLPTREYVNGEWIQTTAKWPKFEDWSASFAARMTLLRIAAGKYPHYKASLQAHDGETFVREVSKTWATDPERAEKVLRIHRKHFPAKQD